LGEFVNSFLKMIDWKKFEKNRTIKQIGFKEKLLE